MLAALATEEVTSPEVRAAAQAYLAPDVRQRFPNPLHYLFRQKYGNKKLVLFWDEFDNAYTPTRRELVATELRFVSNASKRENTLPSFQAVICLGAYNANLVQASGLSPFVPDKTFSYTTLDFTLQETQLLFRQFEEEWQVKVEPEVVADIHAKTGGHTGLVNFCGAFIQQAGGNFDLIRWHRFRFRLLEELKEHKVYENMVAGIENIKDPAVKELLRQLCYSKPGIELSQAPPEEKISSTAANHLQHLGFAVAKKQFAPTPLNYLMIKSEMIRDFSLAYVLHDAPVFYHNQVPLLPDQDQVDLPDFLVSCLTLMSPQKIEEGFVKPRSKLHEMNGELVPGEEVYQQQLELIIQRAFFKIPNWEYAFQITPGHLKDSRLDIFFRRLASEGKPELRVGIELTASVQKGALDRHAKRGYAQKFNLDQFIILNFTPKEHQLTYFCDGSDKEGNPCKVPVFNVWHNRYYTEATLYYQKGDAKMKMELLAGQKEKKKE